MIYDQNLNPVSSCFSSGGNNTPGLVQADSLVPGEIYQIMVDGFAGDICDVTITIIGGVSTDPPDPPGAINADTPISPLCPGAVVCYEIDTVNNATDYHWEIPGNAVIVSGDSTTRICLEFTSAGGGVISVTPSNACYPDSFHFSDYRSAHSTNHKTSLFLLPK
ncbi:MAG: hypothetical protein R2879_15680 [Saprospiraceae bacterium]